MAAGASLAPGGPDPLRPQSPGGMAGGALLALAVHGLLVVALALSVSWRSQTPQTFSAELWAATPQVAAPRAVDSAPAAPPPAPPPPPAPTPRAAAPAATPTPEAKIAIEKARQDKEKAEREAAEREKAQRDKAERDRLAKAEKDKAERERQAAAKAKAEEQARREAQQQRDQQAEAQRLARQREDNLKRIQGLAGASGAPGATGTAPKDAAPSASYAGRLIARIKPNILLTDPVSGSPSADVEVRASPTGSILSRRLVKSSGNKDWDDAVLRAIDRTAELPRDVDGRVPPVLVITFTP
jgi:colicin import membrane protein